MVDRFCLPRVREVLDRELWSLAEDTEQAVRDANGPTAPRVCTGIVLLVHPVAALPIIVLHCALNKKLRDTQLRPP